MDANTLLHKKDVKIIFEKAGISTEKVPYVAKVAFSVIQNKLNQHPLQMSRLLSKQAKSNAQKILKDEVEHDFVEKMTKKVGITETVAKEILPAFMKEFNTFISQNLTDSLNETARKLEERKKSQLTHKF
jgi:nucleoid DNA-binding protein